MAGIIVGAYGFQRSGKSLVSFLMAEHYYKKGIPVYTNVHVEGYNKIERLDDIPFNTSPKVLWLDEVQYYLDSRNWQNNTQSSIFFNTIGKMNILLLLTTIHPDMVEIRLRRQHNFVFLVKSDSKNIYYRLIDNVRGNKKDFMIKKTEKLFEKVRYNSELVPDYVDCDLKRFVEKVKEFNGKHQSKEHKNEDIDIKENTEKLIKEAIIKNDRRILKL